MPQLLIHSESGETSSLKITTDSVTIGRRRGNALCLPHLSVSGYHARITQNKGCLLIEDLDSTNGTIVNGEKIKKQVLVHLDDIIIGSYRISYSETYKTARPHTPRDESEEEESEEDDFAKIESITPIIDPALTDAPEQTAMIRVASGQKRGSVVALEKPITTLGKAGGDMGAISKKSTGYYFLPVNEINTQMRHNGRGLTPQVEVKLIAGDMIEIDGEHLEFIDPSQIDV